MSMYVLTYTHTYVLASIIKNIAVNSWGLALFPDSAFLQTWDFYWKVLVITSVSCIPLYILKYLRKKFSPPVYSKLTP